MRASKVVRTLEEVKEIDPEQYETAKKTQAEVQAQYDRTVKHGSIQTKAEAGNKQA